MMAKLPNVAELLDRIDHEQARFGNLDAELRIAEREEKRCELKRPKRIEQQDHAQADSPVLPNQIQPALAADLTASERQKPGRKVGTSVAVGTTLTAAALAVFMRHGGEDFEAVLRSGNVEEFAKRAIRFATDWGLKCTEHGPDETGSVIRNLAQQMLEAEQAFRAAKQRSDQQARR
jgi:hypothetical protein